MFNGTATSTEMGVGNNYNVSVSFTDNNNNVIETDLHNAVLTNVQIDNNTDMESQFGFGGRVTVSRPSTMVECTLTFMMSPTDADGRPNFFNRVFTSDDFQSSKPKQVIKSNKSDFEELVEMIDNE